MAEPCGTDPTAGHEPRPVARSAPPSSPDRRQAGAATGPAARSDVPRGTLWTASRTRNTRTWEQGSRKSTTPGPPGRWPPAPIRGCYKDRDNRYNEGLATRKSGQYTVRHTPLSIVPRGTRRQCRSGAERNMSARGWYGEPASLRLPRAATVPGLRGTSEPPWRCPSLSPLVAGSALRDGGVALAFTALRFVIRRLPGDERRSERMAGNEARASMENAGPMVLTSGQ
jgi:hypothetical protein